MKLHFIEIALLVLLALTIPAYSQSALNVKDSLGNSLFYIRSDGNVGIGSMNPLARLHVMGDVRSSVLSGPGARLLFADDKGTIFARGTLPRPGWSLTGNKAIESDSNFIGTLDEKALIFKTGGGGSLNERMRIQPEGSITVNSRGFNTGDVFAVYGSGFNGAINSTEGVLSYPVNGYSAGSYSGIYGENTDSGEGVLGVNTSTGSGIFGQNTSKGFGMKGISLHGFGIAGFTNGRNASGILAINQDSSGTGIMALGNGANRGLVLDAGSGLSSTGEWAGLFSTALDSTSGTGIISAGNSLASVKVPIRGSGISGNGEYFGVAGFAQGDTSGREKWGGYFERSGNTRSYAFIGGRIGKTDYGILSSGVNATMVKDASGENRVMFSAASPGALLEDYGTGQLERGFAHVSLDSIFSKAIAVNENNTMKVFVQVEGDCNGVYVTNKTKEGFDIKELRGGRSHVGFSWHAVAARADVMDAEGKVETEYSDIRFPKGGESPELKVYKTSQVKVEREKQLKIKN